jgi:ferredoxin-thioredoxin reductase catalytic subunit
MDVEELFEVLRQSQEKRGYYLNKNEQHTSGILSGLLKNKDRYGYMACPCRLAFGEYEQDRDIICPCVYRKADVMEFGSCYCNLFVSVKHKEDEMDKVVVPERRPPELNL